MFDACRQRYFQSNGEDNSNNNDTTKHPTSSPSLFWAKGFEILENIEERMTVSRNNRRTIDKLTYTTNCDQEKDDSKQDKDFGEDDDVPDISFFCNGQDSSDDELVTIEDERKWKYSNESLINRKNATKEKMIDARMSSGESLLSKNTVSGQSVAANANGEMTGTHGTRGEGVENFDVVMKLVSGSLLGGTPYAQVYANMPDSPDGEEEEDFNSIDVSANMSQRRSNDKFTVKVPTLEGVARAVAREEGTILDEKQYIMYEVLSCTFLLQLISKHSIDGVTSLEKKLRSTLGVGREKDMDQLEKLLKKTGARK